MIAVLGIALGIWLAALCGGRRQRVLAVEIRFASLAVAAFSLQAFARGRLPFSAELTKVSLVVWAASSMVVLIVLWVNRRIAGAWFLLLGTALNLAVVLLNQGMPVVTYGGPAAGLAASAFYHEASARDLVLEWADVLPFPGGWRMSIGDLILMAGIAVFILFNATGQGLPDDLSEHGD